VAIANAHPSNRDLMEKTSSSVTSATIVPELVR
jgi:hypothetical protein